MLELLLLAITSCSPAHSRYPSYLSFFCGIVLHGARYVLSAGGKDVTVNLWKTDVGAVGSAVAEGGTGASPFLQLLDGGEGGEAHNDLVDYFYYAQIMAQGEVRMPLSTI